MTFHVCATDPLPTFTGLWDSIEIPFPPPSITIPSLPTLMNPIFDGYSNIAQEISQIIQGLQSYQLLFTQGSFLTTFTDFLGLDISIVLPKIPGTDLNLQNLLALDPVAIYDGIAQAILDGVTFPFVPNPMFYTFDFPALDIVNTVNAVVNGYMQQVITTATSLITSITDQLEIPGMPALPAFPSLSDIYTIMLAKFPTFPDIESLILSGIPIPDLFSLTVPGFPALPDLPAPLIPNFSSYDIEFKTALNTYFANLTTAPLQTIVNFCNGPLSSLGFSFPLLCVDF